MAQLPLVGAQAPYDPDEIDEQEIVITLNRIANTGRQGLLGTAPT